MINNLKISSNIFLDWGCSQALWVRNADFPSSQIGLVMKRSIKY